jgi:hypothetical protein
LEREFKEIKLVEIAMGVSTINIIINATLFPSERSFTTSSIYPASTVRMTQGG